MKRGWILYTNIHSQYEFTNIRLGAVIDYIYLYVKCEGRRNGA